MSIDTKKKELIGDFYRAGAPTTQGTIETFDHDFPSLPGRAWSSRTGCTT